MSILDIKARFSQRILDAEKDAKEAEVQHNGTRSVTFQIELSSDVQEKDVGILEYVSDLPGFHGVMKQRFSDFNVHEIDVDDQMAVLNSFEIPDEQCAEVDKDTTLLTEEDVSSIDKIAGGDESVSTLAIDVTEMSKDQRKGIHQYVKGKYGSALVSETKEDDVKKFIIVSRNSKATDKCKRPSSHLPKFVHFILSKSNMDTNEALHILGKKLRIHPKSLNICGTKDKRGNTSQWVSVKQVLASRLNNLNKTLRKMMVGNFIYKDFALSLGHLHGNNFQIALRNIVVPDKDIEEAVSNLKERGFINYFGLQRFGKCAVSPTHEIGKHIIKEAYSNAVELILKPRGGMDQPDMRQAREIWARTRDPGQALSALITKDKSIEGKVLLGLKKNGSTAFVNALNGLPRTVRLMYIHAYQSLVWNKVASRRIAKYGLAVLEGDLVYADSGTEEAADFEGDDECDEELEGEPEKKLSPVKTLTNEDLSSYDIYDIVLPLPGTSTVYPNNEVSEWYKEILSEDGLSIHSFESRTKQYSLSGSYRHLLRRPKNFTWKIVRYSKPDDDLLLNDMEILQGKTLPEHPDGQLKALIVSFDLTPSTYATMALREILRSDTSASNQNKLGQSLLKRSGDTIDDEQAKRRKEDDSSDEKSVCV